MLRTSRPPSRCLAPLSRSHLVDIADPLGFLTADYTCSGSDNISHFCDPAIDAKLAASDGMASATNRDAVYAEVARDLEDNAVTVFILHEQTLEAHSASVSGFVADPLGRYAVTNTGASPHS